ncbi:multidrug effflux MFS transporter [Xylophilus sp. GOD-11R]|uniref:multidrug effflux MFS transporter n=1 Tax=Xylophilus sp. GOD-11R TaxID=3089814 RepID=UPI00298D0B28|nr:multidrug effflux MFS transporter [Xylophilus sp. GOD-11R]WPB55196.1 multidrug effflux MFS transporter [Xylophilus sp. GOD-11R]
MSSRAISPTSPLYVVMLGLLSALPPFGTDAGLPGLVSLQADLGVVMAEATRTLTIFMLGFSIGPVLFGPLSDRFGRKPILLLGVFVFSCAALGCALSDSIGTLLFMRFVQGVGAGAAASLPAAIVRDVYHDELALSRQSLVALVNGVAPLIAPLLGAAVLTFAGWRAVYGALAVLGIAILLMAAVGYAETAPRRPDPVRRSVLHTAMVGYRAVLGDRRYLAATGLLAATFGVMFSYITGSSAVFMEQLGATPALYSLLFACTASGTILGAASNSRLSRRFGANRVLATAVIGNVVVALALLTVGGLGVRSMALTAGLVVLSNLCAGIIMPTATHRGLRALGHVAGSAAALQRCMQMVSASVFGTLVGLIGGQSLVAMATSMTVASLLAVGLWLAGREAPQAAATAPRAG